MVSLMEDCEYVRRIQDLAVPLGGRKALCQWAELFVSGQMQWHCSLVK